MRQTARAIRWFAIGFFGLASLLFAGNGPLKPGANYYSSTPLTGRTSLSGGAGCTGCHGGGLTVTLTGGSQLYPGQGGTYTIATANGTSGTRFGINVATNGGTLAVSSASLEVVGGEIRHRQSPATLATIVSGAANYTFTFTMSPAATVGNTYTVAGVAAAGFAGAAGAAADKSVTAIRPATPAGLATANITAGSVDLSWSGAGPAYRVLYKTGSYPVSPTDGTATDVSGTSTTISGLSAATIYYFAVYARATFSATNTFSSAATTATATTAIALDPNPWVDAVNGSDSNSGASTSPFKTIKMALTAVGVGGTIHVQPGTYNTAIGETFPITVPSGIKLLSTFGASTTIIDATGANTRVLYFNGNSNSTVVEGFTITGGLFTQQAGGGDGNGGGILAENADQTSVYRCIISGNEVRGASGGSHAYGGGLCIIGSTTKVSDCVICNNIARGGNGVFVGNDGGNAYGGGIWSGGAIIVTNNTFYGNEAIGGNGGPPSSFFPPLPAGAAGGAFYAAMDASSATAVNNIIANNAVIAGVPGYLRSSGTAIGGGISTTAASYNLYYNNTGGDGFVGPNSITGQDPLFVNAPTDLHLRSSSPAKHAGRLSGAPAVDLDNRTRGVQPTIGAYETGLLPTAYAGIGRFIIKWSGLDGASSYNLYYGPSGTTLTTSSPKVTGVTSPYVFLPVLNSTVQTFALTAIENGVEGPISPQTSAVASAGASGAWLTTSAGGTSYTNLTQDLANGNILYATTTDSVGLYKSTNAGDTWTALPGPYTSGLHAVAANGSNVLVAGSGAIYRSTNGGSTWTTVFSGGGIGEDFVNSIAIDPFNTLAIYAGDFHVDFGTTSSYLIVKSVDGGATFHNLTDATAADLRAHYLQIDPAIAGTVYAEGSGSPFIGKSTDKGGTWTSATPAGNGYPTALAIAPSLTSTLYAGMKNTSNTTFTGVFKSIDSGSTWNAASGTTNAIPADINALLVDPANASHVHGATPSGYYITTDGGTNWNPGNPGTGSNAINAFAQTTSRRLIATTTISIIMIPLDAAPTISSLNLTTGSTSGGTSVTVNGTGFRAATGVRVLFGGVDALVNIGSSSGTALVVTAPMHAAGTVDVAVINPDGQAAINTSAFTYDAGLITLTAKAVSGQVLLDWNSVKNATQYQVLRSTAGGSLAPLSTVASPGYTDSAVSNGTGYIYQVTVTAGASGTSNVDLAVPMSYTHPALGAGQMILAADWMETRTAVNAAHVAAGLGTVTFTDNSLAGVRVKKVHLIELRTAIDQARAAVGLSPLTYTDSTITIGSTKVKAVHLAEVREAVK